MAVEDVKREREAREQAARETAMMVGPGEYYADGNNVRDHEDGKVVATCTSHWDACLVMLYTGTPDAYGRTGEMEDCYCCGGTGLEYDETCVTCGGFGWIRHP